METIIHVFKESRVGECSEQCLRTLLNILADRLKEKKTESLGMCGVLLPLFIV